VVWITFTRFDSFLHKSSLIEISKRLAEHGFDVEVFAQRSKKRFHVANSHVRLRLVPLMYFPIVTPFLFAIAMILLLPFVMARRRPGFIMMEPGPSALAVVWKPLTYLSKSKIVLDIRSTPVEITNHRASLVALWFDIAMGLAKSTVNGITTLTDSMKRELCHRFRIDPAFVGVFTSGVSPTLFEPRRYNGMDMRRKIGLDGKFVVFYHGNISARRGIIEAVEAVSLLKDDHPDVTFFLLGNGPAVPAVCRIAKERGIQDKVIIHDSVEYDEVPKYIAMCDVGIVPLPDLPDWRHQCPLKLLEYFSMEKVAIVSDIPAHRQVAGRSACGIYLRGTSPGEIAMAIRYALENKSLLGEWGSCGRTIVNEKYNWDKVAEDLEDYLARL